MALTQTALNNRLQTSQTNLSRMLRRAVRAHEDGAFDKAQRLYVALLHHDPKNFDVLHLLGLLYHQRGALDLALRHYDDALKIIPGDLEVLNKRGIALLESGRAPAALANFDQMLACDADHVDALGNRGNALLKLNRAQEALASYDTALRVAPRHPRLLTNRAHALRRLDRPQEALMSASSALAADANFAEAHFEESLARLTLGDFGAGWRAYESRWATAAFAAQRRNFDQPLWLGDRSASDQTNLLHAEQGFGDTLQFIRYAPHVAARGAKVIAEVQPEVARLISGMHGIHTVVPRGQKLPRFDLHCPLLSLPLACGTQSTTIPADIPYIAPDPIDVAAWRARLPAHKLRVGLTWAGCTSHKNDLNRSVRLAVLAPLLDLPDVLIVSLQHDVDARDAAVLRASPQVFQAAEPFRDFADTAALISLLDLVISVDTAVAHVAGALGKPLWLLLPFAADFRWLRERHDTPWYPTARLFRQQQFEDWSGVIDQVRVSLQSLSQPVRKHC